MPSEVLYPASQTHVLGARDPIVDAIGLLRPRTVIEPSLHAAGPWAMRVDPFRHVKLGGVARGQCWLTLEGHDPVQLHEGDFYLLGDPPSYVLSSEPGVEPIPAARVRATATTGSVHLGPAAEVDTSLCGGHFAFDDACASILLDALPPMVLVRAADPRGELLDHVCQLLIAEAEAASLGGSLVLEHLAQILFVYMLRAHAEQTDRPTGWLGALNHDGVGAALRAMHADIAHRWSLSELAGIARMSRSAFAASFKRQVGVAPMEYVIQWRMSLARDALRHGRRSISDVAFATGYESESAFSTAFRRVVGSPPRQYRDDWRHQAKVRPTPNS